MTQKVAKTGRGHRIGKIPIALGRKNHKESQGKIFGKRRQEVIFLSNVHILCEKKIANH